MDQRSYNATYPGIHMRTCNPMVAILRYTSPGSNFEFREATGDTRWLSDGGAIQCSRSPGLFAVGIGSFAGRCEYCFIFRPVPPP